MPLSIGIPAADRKEKVGSLFANLDKARALHDEAQTTLKKLVFAVLIKEGKLNNQTIMFTRAKYRQLKTTYNQALQDGATEFEFEGHTLLVAYAKYLLEYLEITLRQTGELY